MKMIMSTKQTQNQILSRIDVTKIRLNSALFLLESQGFEDVKILLKRNIDKINGSKIIRIRDRKNNIRYKVERT
jgi:hypothetical protein